MQTETDLQEIRLTIKRGPLDNRPRQLVINSKFLSFEDNDLSSEPYSQVDLRSIKDFRYGIKPIRGFEFTVGREYQIFIRDQDEYVIKINFKSLYGRRKAECHDLYSQIFNALWRFRFSNITNDLLDKFKKGEEFTISNATFTKDKLTITTTGILKEEIKEINWDKVGTKDYQTYFAIYSIDDPAKINYTYNYLNDWNTGVLYSVVRTILRDKENETQN